ncbi:4510_t:CDS:2 [Funneliformis mosseae]|uniref:4510_t:CDS:1 n=1 Tax=Funneliformis mosseae TaxID=27381 RepID=A0A9N8VCC0_FUNMO|nr:4510_t:CDS:2 [Funneliformis mosseae]
MTLLFEFFPKLTQNLSHLLEDVDDSDVIIKVGEKLGYEEW